MKNILFVLSKPPHSGAYLQETLDTVITAAAFDQEVNLLFLDKAVFQLKKHQQLSDTGLKDTAPIFKALPFYNIQDFYVETESLLENGLSAESLNESVKLISRNQIGIFLKQFNLLLNC
ncbi:MAG: sulfurtransferase complex subunit TusC [Methylococcaceae bacterium]|nr:sulfurtransferase complex subunit TusC [Methylococcaceae bacterium]